MDLAAERLVTQRFFYGWIIVFLNFVAAMITSGIGNWGLSFFVVPMSQEMGVSRGAFSAITIFRLVPLPLLPLLGLLADKKHGPRVILAVGGLLGGLSLVLSAMSQGIWQFYLTFGVGFGLAMSVLGGQLVGPAVIAKWFIQMRGRAMAIGTMGVSAGGVIVAPLAAWAVAAHGWRMAWVILGLAVVLAITPFSALFMRRSPEDMGLLPDDVPNPRGQARTKGTNLAAGYSAEYSFTLHEALRSRALWVLLGVQVLASTALIPVIIHQTAYVQDKHFSPQVAATTATIVAFCAIAGKLPWGFIGERLHARWTLVLCMIPSGLTLMLLVVAQSVPMLYTYAVLHGLTMGGWVTLSNVAWATYFGRRHLGTIRGVVAPVGSIMGAVSPVLAGWMWDLQGSYDLIFTIYAFIWVLAGLLMLLAKPPKPPLGAKIGSGITADAWRSG